MCCCCQQQVKLVQRFAGRLSEENRQGIPCGFVSHYISQLVVYLQHCGLYNAHVHYKPQGAPCLFSSDNLPAKRCMQLLLVCRREASLAPYYLSFFINDLSLIPSFSTPYFFADDTKFCTKILSLSDSSRLQEDLTAGVPTAGLLSTSSRVVCCFFLTGAPQLLMLLTISVNQISLP